MDEYGVTEIEAINIVNGYIQQIMYKNIHYAKNWICRGDGRGI